MNYLDSIYNKCGFYPNGRVDLFTTITTTILFSHILTTAFTNLKYTTW